LSSSLNPCRSHPQALPAAGHPNGRQTATEFFHDIQELEISAIHSLIKNWKSIRPIRDVGTRPSEALSIRLPLSSVLLPGQRRCNPSSRQIRCTRLWLHAPALQEQAPIDPAPSQRTMATCHARMLCRSLCLLKINNALLVAVCGWRFSVLSDRQARRWRKPGIGSCRTNNGSRVVPGLRSFLGSSLNMPLSTSALANNPFELS